MSDAFAVVFLDSAERDLRELKTYIVKNFGQRTWQICYDEIRNAANLLKTFPLKGDIPDELESVNFTQFRQVLPGMSRLIYEARQNAVYIHIVCDIRTDMRSLLTRRLLRAF